MRCSNCGGVGVMVFDDYESVPCLRCDGTGRVNLWFRLRIWIGVRIDMQIENVRFTRFGKWYWKRWDMERRAIRLARENTPFQLQAMAGRSLERLREFATHIENGIGVERAYQIEIRLQAEAALACKLKPMGKWSNV